jgi:hypothetical protein
MKASPTTPEPLASHWNAGGWFGSQLGGTAWLFVSAAVLAFESGPSAAFLLGCGLVANAAGCLLWARRARLDPYRALQALVAVVVLAGAAAIRWLELRGELALLEPRLGPPAMYLLFLALLVALVALFEARRRAARRTRAAGDPTPGRTAPW